LRGKASAACGLVGRFDRQRARRGLPGKAFFAAPSLAGGLPGEECHARHVPVGRFGRSWGWASASFLPIGPRPCSRTRAPNTSDGACRVRPLFTKQYSQPSRRCEEGRHRATLGERLCDQALADAVGRRGLFPQGRCPHVLRSTALEGNAPSGDADRRSRRPGLKNASYM
jgi:hypothetical protein